MVSLRFTNLAVLALLLIVMHHALSNSSAYAHQGINKNGPPVIGQNIVPIVKEPLDHGNPDTAPAMKIWPGGRRMLEDEVLRKEIEKEEDLKGGTSKSAINSGATHFDGKCKPDKKSASGSKINVAARFVVFRADYSTPKTRPPKQNG